MPHLRSECLVCQITLHVLDIHAIVKDLHLINPRILSEEQMSIIDGKKDVILGLLEKLPVLLKDSLPTQ